VTGQVKDAGTGDPLPRANLAIKNTLWGTVADNEGNFTLQVKSLPVTLMVSYIGYETAEVEVSKAQAGQIALSETSLEVEDMVIVGSRFVPRTVITSPVPIDNIKVGDLVGTGQLTFDKMMTYAVPSFNSTQQTISDATAHFDPADLRGLGPSRTLVLINGKRKSPSSLVYINDRPGKGEVGVDMKSIPVASIERIEVLRDGASAQYGSDAIAGVINIILKNEAQGTDVELFAGTMDEGDGDFRGYSINTGFQLGEKGFLNLTHTFSDQDETNRAPSPGKDGLFGDLVGIVDTAQDSAWIDANPDPGMRVGLPNSTTSDVFFNSRLPLQGNAELYSFGGLQYRKGISYALYRAPYWIPDQFNIYHDAGETYNGFHPTFEGDIFDNTLAVGIRGQKRSWDFDLSHNTGRNTVDYTVRNSLNLDLGAETPTTFRVGGYEFGHNVTNLDLSRRIFNTTVSLGSEFRTM
jgi:iron complex outermembrane receptor protein